MCCPPVAQMVDDCANKEWNVHEIMSSLMSEANIQNQPSAPSGDSAIEGSAVLDISLSDVLTALVAGYGKKANDADKKKFADLLSRRLIQETNKNTLAAQYNIVVLFDNTILIKSDSDRIYSAVRQFQQKKPLLLVLLSRGGELGSAYLIGKLCRDSADKKFVVVVPRYAKSAATLIATAADEIHMGGLSELGPIDPQIDEMPALGLKNSIEHIAELVSRMPKSADMFAKYLQFSVKPIQIGYFERAAESAKQYAKILLETHKDPESAEVIADQLVYKYKDHGFVIDKSEAKKIFSDTIKSDTPEYSIGNAVYDLLSEIEYIAGLLNYNFYFHGGLEAEPGLTKREK